MPFGVVRGVGRGMGVLDGGGDRRRERASFGGEFGARSSQITLRTCSLITAETVAAKLASGRRPKIIDGPHCFQHGCIIQRVSKNSSLI